MMARDGRRNGSAGLETVTRQSGRLPETPAYGSWLLGGSRKARAADGYAFSSS